MSAASSPTSFTALASEAFGPQRPLAEAAADCCRRRPHAADVRQAGEVPTLVGTPLTETKIELDFAVAALPDPERTVVRSSKSPTLTATAMAADTHCGEVQAASPATWRTLGARRLVRRETGVHTESTIEVPSGDEVR
jgi:hypothetical protein